MRAADDARYRPQPGDTYTTQFDTYTVESVAAYGVVTLCAPKTWGGRVVWPLAWWSDGGGVWTPGTAPPVLPCRTCAKSRSRATACGDVPADPTTCTRYYPRTGA